jgi:hypothetical protein
MVEGGHECESCERVFKRTEGIATGWRYAFTVRDAATALVRAGIGGGDNSYRAISTALRVATGRTTRRGRFKDFGFVPTAPQMAIDYLDAFAGIVNSVVAPTSWPAILTVDDKPVYKADHSKCCKPFRDRGEKPPRHHRAKADDGEIETEIVLGDVTADPALNTDDELFGRTLPVVKSRPKVDHDAPMVEVGRIMVAVGYERPGDKPRLWLIRYAGGGDEASWTEFLEALPGCPEWIVSDRDGAIAGAVRTVFPTATHYLCEQHLAQNAADVAREKDNVRTKCARLNMAEAAHPIWPALEAAQWDEDHWVAAMKAAQESVLPETERWLITNTTLAPRKWKNRREGYPRAAGACERVIVATWAAIGSRMSVFRNADRMNLLLGLVRSNIDRTASVPAYSKILRAAFAEVDGHANPEWGAIRDPVGESSITILFTDAQERAKAATSRRAAPRRAALHREKRAAYEQERMILGLPRSPSGRPRVLRASGSVAGKSVADFPWLVREWHETKNGDLIPSDVPAGSGSMIWWRCSAGPDHEWASQVRSRTLRGTGCRFCAHKAVAKSEALTVTHPDITAQWHPTRDGKNRPENYTFGSHHEAWWQCPKFKGHVWRARISSRTSMLAGCSLCGGRARHDAIDTNARSA